ncbi:MAG: hypothetical protein AAF960_08220 [Bacteroidota bacterium]
MKNLLQRILFFGLVLNCLACQQSVTDKSTLAIFTPSKQASGNSTITKLDDYWYQGKAEISSYDLAQVRYRDQHPGEAVLIFVTEDFLTDKQVKNDNYTNKNSTPILKNNSVRRFTTGIYDYSIMTSVFTPTNTEKFPNTQKVTISAQDWCGQSFMQFNREKSKYKVVLRSYFESEGDKDFTVNASLLEDELMNRIRINPDALPVGKTSLVPSATILRLMHLPTRSFEANITKGKYKGNELGKKDLIAYTIDYPELDRQVTIFYQQKAPYIIEGWQDTYRAISGEKLTTRATRKQTVMTPYWQQNNVREVKLRKDLDLVTF